MIGLHASLVSYVKAALQPPMSNWRVLSARPERREIRPVGRLLRGKEILVGRWKRCLDSVYCLHIYLKTHTAAQILACVVS